MKVGTADDSVTVNADAALVTVDGLDNSQRRTNRQIRLVISTPESVQEMQVLSGTYSAEFGRAVGGIINVISRSDVANSPFGETFHTPSAKLSFNLNAKNSGFLRYNRFTNDQPQPEV